MHHRRQIFLHSRIIDIPIVNSDEKFGWGVWISQKKENFEIYRSNYNSADIGPFFGWLSTELTIYHDSTINFRSLAHFRGNGLRPSIEIAPSEHLLYRQQSKGITLADAWEMVHYYS